MSLPHAQEAELSSSVLFGCESPSEPGCYWMKCDENGQIPEFVRVYHSCGSLVCALNLGEGYEVKSITDGLTNVTWAAAMIVKPNPELRDAADK